jgi:hypothetical protein
MAMYRKVTELALGCACRQRLGWGKRTQTRFNIIEVENLEATYVVPAPHPTPIPVNMGEPQRPRRLDHAQTTGDFPATNR